jgi:DNA adenine methylase
MSGDLRAPFPWFGGKSRVAPLVWERFGNVPNYVEPFFGSGAVLLGRPHTPNIETVNDLDGMLVNFWRATTAAPTGVLAAARRVSGETELAARHRWLRERRGSLEAELRADPEAFDTEVAGVWVWGLCNTVAEAWHRHTPQRPALSTTPQGLLSHDNPEVVLRALSDRLLPVRVLCGDWRRSVTPERLRVRPAAVFLDPPYSEGEHCVTYAGGVGSVAVDVREWAIEQGDDPTLRIALCGYAGEHEMPDGWTVERWKAPGGFSNQGNGRGKENAARETIWFNPHCHRREQGDLLASLEAA